MTVAHPTHGADRMGGGPGWHFTEWTLGILGGIAAFLGLFTFFAGDQSSIGLGGDWTWEVGEIAAGTKWALLVGGVALLGVSAAMGIAGRHRLRPKTRVSEELSNLMWHTGVFVVVNTFIWLQDIALGGGVDYAFWVTVPWAIGLAAHAYAYSRDRTSTT